MMAVTTHHPEMDALRVLFHSKARDKLAQGGLHKLHSTQAWLINPTSSCDCIPLQVSGGGAPPAPIPGLSQLQKSISMSVMVEQLLQLALVCRDGC